MSVDDIAAVIIGRNEGERLLVCLNSVAAVTEKVVYVDSGSTDSSPAAAAKLGALVVRLDARLPFSAARARNEGFAIAVRQWPAVKYIQFIDGDCELAAGWLETASSFIDRRKDIAVVCGRRRERYPNASIYNRMCDLEWATPVGEAIACGGDSLARKAAFEMVEGFRPQLIAGEEPELCIRLREMGWKIWRLDAEMTIHDAAMKHFSQWWIRAVRSGYGYAAVTSLHRGSSFAIWRRDIRSAILWGGSLPAIVLLGSFVRPMLFGLALIYPLQVSRMAIRRTPVDRFSWIASFFVLIAQFAVLLGMLKYWWNRLHRRKVGLIEYKR